MVRTDQARRSGFLLILFWMAMIALLPLTVFGEYTTVLSSGPTANRVNLVFLSDGYTADQLEPLYTQHLKTMINHLFDANQDPYPRYRKFFNLYRIDVASNESGADVPPQNTFRDTALDASYYYDGTTSNSLYIDARKVAQTLQAQLQDAPFTPAAVFVAVNDSRSGGGTGTYAAYAAANAIGPEIALHEMGHAFSNLADEYGGIHEFYPGPEPTEVNVTTSPTGEKWSVWLGYNQPGLGLIGTYPGACYYDQGVYAPSSGSKMRYLNRPFDAIAREKIILDIYTLVRPLDAWTDNSTTIIDPERLEVRQVDADVTKIEWSVNGSVVPGAEGDSFSPGSLGLAPGDYSVSVRVYDPTDWVRRHRELLEETITWSVRYTHPTIASGVDNATGADNASTPLSLVSANTIPPAKAVEQIQAVATFLDNSTAQGIFNPATWCTVPALLPMGLLFLGLLAICGTGLIHDPD